MSLQALSMAEIVSSSAQLGGPILLGLTPGPQEGQVPSLCRLDDRCAALLLLSDSSPPYTLI